MLSDPNPVLYRKLRRRPALSGLARLAAARGDHTTAQKLQARAATIAERDGAPPHTLQTAATTT
jgi:hypothetical protein